MQSDEQFIDCLSLCLSFTNQFTLTHNDMHICCLEKAANGNRLPAMFVRAVFNFVLMYVFCGCGCGCVALLYLYLSFLLNVVGCLLFLLGNVSSILLCILSSRCRFSLFVIYFHLFSFTDFLSRHCRWCYISVWVSIVWRDHGMKYPKLAIR